MDFQNFLDVESLPPTLYNYRIYLAGQIKNQLEEQYCHPKGPVDFTPEQRKIIAKRLKEVANIAKERYGLEPNLNNTEQDVFVIDSIVKVIGEAVLIDNRGHDSMD